MKPRDMQAREAAGRAARDSFGRLLAYLSARTGDIGAAEDALADALVAALERWPVQGVPQNPEAWLLVTARRRRLDTLKHEGVVHRAEPALLRAAQDAEQVANTPRFPDDRLRLLLVCAHPAIDADSHAPLMLQTVLGLDAARIARAFAVEPAAMGQRLVRTKRKILSARIPFSVPEPETIRQRLGAVLDAIYAAYGTGWDESGHSQNAGDLTSEALFLATLVEGLSGRDPEALGLVALMGLCEARRNARRDDQGRYVPLSLQNPAQWHLPGIAAAEATLREAATARVPGRFQLEAAIQSAVSVRAYGKDVDWSAVELLYEGLIRGWPSAGALVGRAAVVATLHGPAAGLLALSAVQPSQAAVYQPYWAARASFLAQQGADADAVAAYDRAVSMTRDLAVKGWLEEQRAKLRI